MEDAGGPTDRDHAALMDRIYRYQRHFYDCSRIVVLPERDRLLQGMDISTNQKILEIGCGTARNCLFLAREHEKIEIYGLDVSKVMLEKAESKVTRAGYSSQIKLKRVFAENGEFAKLFMIEHFDHIFFSYSLSMIKGWQQTLEHALIALKPSGWIHIVDFGDLTNLPKCVGSMFRRWFRRYHVQPRMEIIDFFAGKQDHGKGTLEVTWLSSRYAFLMRFHWTPQ